MSTTIDDLRALGYQVGVAHGSVQVEEAALAAARAAADPTVVAQTASDVTAATVRDLAAAGKLPQTPAERLELAQQIAAGALDLLTESASETVAFHERAVEIAKTMPDVWRVEQHAGDTVVFSGLVSCTADGTGWDPESQDLLDTLADTDAYAERQYQGEHRAAMAVAAELVDAGVQIVRPVAGADRFEAEGRTLKAADLDGLLAEVTARPTPRQKVAAALAAASELSETTRQALLDALG